MLKIVSLHGGSCPALVCDVCKELITDHKIAIAAYPSMDTEGGMETCYHVHKGQCDATLKVKLGAKTRWQELRNHLQYLHRNVKLSHEDLKEDEFDKMISN